jgi:cellulase/cellobiase CelA1
VKRWYRDHVDADPQLAATERARARFVVDTSRNGRGRLAVAAYGAAPYNQPPDIVDKLRMGDFCNPPGAGLGPRPSASTGEPLVDAHLWIKIPGQSDGSCDVAGGPRAWDYGRYNPWGVAGEAQRHFDPLWGMVDPQIGDWFPEQAIEVARNATPPLDQVAPTTAVEATAASMGVLTSGAARPPTGGGARPGARPARRPGESPPAAPHDGKGAASPDPGIERPRDNPPPRPVTLDQQNPYN